MFHLKQFILTRLEYDATLQKVLKKPINSDGYLIDPIDRKNWRSYEDVKAIVDANPANGSYPCFATAFVLSADDPYFCIDIDSCRTPDGKEWTDFAQGVCAMFPGGRIEVSASGNGLHVWGQARTTPPHKCKNVSKGLEFYTQKRFIVLGENSNGSPDIDFSAPIMEFVESYMKQDAAAGGGPAEWTYGPCQSWAGPTDDDALIELAVKSKNYASVFGGAVSFEDLWEANEETLGRHWPDSSGNRSYDASSADMSLAQRLAYWTGKDCERMLRIMNRSKLKRDKWEQREDYLKRTIIQACTAQKEVYSKKSFNPETGTSKKFARGFVGADEIPEVFDGCVYIIDRHEIVTPEGIIVNPERFRVLYGGYVFSLDDHKTTRDAFEAFTKCPTWRMPAATSVCFRPELPPLTLIEEESKLMVNTYIPITTRSREGDVSRFTWLLERTFPEERDREILTSYLAAVVQNPGKKFQWAPLIQGPEGSGKTFIAEAMIRAIGSRYCQHINARDLDNKFNGWILDKLFVMAEEVRVSDRHEVTEALKELITNSRIPVQLKGKDQFTADNRANFLFTSNYMDAIAVKENSRRYAPVMTGPQSAKEMEKVGLNQQFFRDLWDWAKGDGKYEGQAPGFESVAHYLKSYQVCEEYNPAGNCVRAPRTASFDRFVNASAGRVEQEIMEAVEEGRQGFAGGWVSSKALDRLLEEKRLASRISHVRRKEILHELGFVPHPALPHGRATKTVLPDGGRPRLYLRNGHLSLNEPDPGRVCGQYEAAQDAAVQMPMTTSEKIG